MRLLWGARRYSRVFGVAPKVPHGQAKCPRSCSRASAGIRALFAATCDTVVTPTGHYRRPSLIWYTRGTDRRAASASFLAGDASLEPLADQAAQLGAGGVKRVARGAAWAVTGAPRQVGQ